MRIHYKNYCLTEWEISYSIKSNQKIKNGLINEIYNYKRIKYDVGEKLRFLQSNIEYALTDEKLEKEFRKYLDTINTR